MTLEKEKEKRKSPVEASTIKWIREGSRTKSE
jgi:hypothetical protein